MSALETFLTVQANSHLVDCIERGLALAEGNRQRAHLAHVVDALLCEDGVRNHLPSEKLVEARAHLAGQMQSQPVAKNGEAGRLAFDLGRLVVPALALANDCGADRVSPLLFLATCITASFGPADRESARTAEFLHRSGITLSDLMARSQDSGSAKRADYTYQSLGFGVDLTAMARNGYWSSCPLVGMERELKHLVVTISSSASSVVVVGEPGVGKSALVNGLAYHIAQKTRPLIPPEMDNQTLVAISPMNLLAGTGGRGELEARLNELLDFFRVNPNVIPFFDEVHTLLDTDDPSARTIATALKPPMAAGIFRCIGATTDQEYVRFISGDEAMNSRFDKILIAEPDHESALKIIKGSLGGILSGKAREKGVEVLDEAIKAAIRITAQYQKNDRLPRKAIRLLGRVVAETVYQSQVAEAAEAPSIDAPQVAAVFSDLTGIPMSDLDSDRPAYFRELADRLSQRVRGQMTAIEAVTSWLSIQSSGWVDPRRPRGRFLYLGPPGVGKTQLAMALAEEVMRDRGSLVVKNMAEYKGDGAKSRFMGADPGYVGFGQTATIYNKVMMRAYSVVVLDEIEKAHAELADPLLSVLDGSGEDSQGRRVDFSQCIFVLTSNSLQSLCQESLTENEIRRALLDLGGIWTPPMVDRLDRIVVFRPLTADVLSQILDDLIDERRRQASRSLPPELDDPACRAAILAWALEGTGGTEISARGLERALLRWLTEAAGGGGFARVETPVAELVVEDNPQTSDRAPDVEVDELAPR